MPISGEGGKVKVLQIQQLSSVLSDWSTTDKDPYRYCQPQKKKRGWEKSLSHLTKETPSQRKKKSLNLDK